MCCVFRVGKSDCGAKGSWTMELSSVQMRGAFTAERMWRGTAPHAHCLCRLGSFIPAKGHCGTMVPFVWTRRRDGSSPLAQHGPLDAPFFASYMRLPFDSEPAWERTIIALYCVGVLASLKCIQSID